MEFLFIIKIFLNTFEKITYIYFLKKYPTHNKIYIK